VQISQFTFFKGSNLLAMKLFAPATEIAYQETRQFEFGLREAPTAVNIRGTINRQQPLDVTAPVGTTQYECGLIQLSLPGQPTPSEGPQLPPELGGITPSLSPQQAISRLQANGFDLAVQGSEAEPKFGNVADPLIIGALGPGFLTGVGYWASAPGQLRSAVIFDQPAANMVLLVFSNMGGFCFSITPVGGGLTLFCDRPAVLAPSTTFGGGPVPGTVFLILVLKIGGPTQPFVLSLAG